MTDMSSVTVVISQGGTIIATLVTDDQGECSTVLNAGTYSVAFSYAGRNPVTRTVIIDYNNTLFFFVFPNITNAGSGIVATLLYDNDVSFTGTETKVPTAVVTWVNT